MATPFRTTSEVIYVVGWSGTLSGTSLTLSGILKLADGTAAAPSLAFTTAPTLGMYRYSASAIAFATTGSKKALYLDSVTLALPSDSSLYWASTAQADGTGDVILVRDAAAVLALRNSTTAQRFLVYNTFTNASNYESGILGWSSNSLVLGTDASGTGSARNIIFSVGGGKWQVSTAGHFLAITDNANDIGATGATRPRDIHVGRDVNVARDLNVASSVLLNSRAYLTAGSATGILIAQNLAGDDFNRMVFGVSGTTTAGVSLVKEVGHLIEKRGDGSTGTLSVANVGAASCGTTAATIVGTDKAFRVTVGATSGTECRVTFVSAWTTAPVCIVNNETTANLARTDSPTTTTIDLAGTFVGGDVLSVVCSGY